MNLVAALIDANQPLTRHDLRTRIGGYSDDDEAFRRNFERDKDLLRQMGMPLVIEPVDPRRPEGPRATAFPASATNCPTRASTTMSWPPSTWPRRPSPWKGPGGTRRPPPPSGSWPDRAPPPTPSHEAGRAGAAPAPTSAPDRLAPDQALAELPGGERVAVLFGAVAARQRVRLTYRGEGRDVDPWRLSYRRGQWYLAGFGPSPRRGAPVPARPHGAAPSAVGEPGAFARPAGAAAGPPPPWRLGDERRDRGRPAGRRRSRPAGRSRPSGRQRCVERRADGGRWCFRSR